MPDAFGQITVIQRPPFRWRFYAFSLLVLALLVVVAGRGVGRWLVREDPLARADVIVVLSGSMPYRAEEGGRLFKLGEAPEIWLTRPESPTAVLQKLGIQYVGEEQYSRQILLRMGAPESSVRILPDEVANTEQEVIEIAKEMQRTKKPRVIIVSSPQHTRRVRALWGRLAAKDLHAIVRAAYEDPYNPDHWWRNTHDVFSVIREMLGLLNVWIGLPVRPNTT